MSETTNRETHGFQTEVKQLLQLMIHSLYSNKEIFLRELISNASDAADKLRFEALSNNDLLEGDSDLKIQLKADKETGTLTIVDNGIGMSREEIKENLGTIAKSGTADFLKTLSGDKKNDAQLIGQFGVGFYSAFIVADRVEVISRRAGEPDDSATHWESAGDGEFTLEPATAPRGTTIVLHLKADEKEFSEPFRLKALVRRYSDHIAFPVVMESEVTAEPSEDGDEAVAETTTTEETLNSATALWTRSRSDIKDDEYDEFYKYLSHDFESPLCHSHNRVEGKREYTSLLYIPARAPFDLWNREAPRGLKLYVQRVFIMDNAEQFLPLYLRFVRGIVDASDLPLNVSRELLQSNADVEAIRSALTRRVLDMLSKLAKNEPEKFQTFWAQFGEVLKEGLAEDPQNAEKIAALLRFTTTKSADDSPSQSLDAYLERMGAEQQDIYYLTADNLTAARKNPHLEVFKNKDLEVLLLTDRLDDWMIGHLPSYKDKTLRDISRGDLELPGDDKDAQANDDDGEHSELLERLRKLLEDDVASVKLSRRLVDSPACLVVGENDMGPQMRRLLEASGQAVPDVKPEFEINAGHSLIERLATIEADDRFESLARVLLDQARLAAGEALPDPGSYVERINSLLLELGA